jgi:hypothetical protein
MIKIKNKSSYLFSYIIIISLLGVVPSTTYAGPITGIAALKYIKDGVSILSGLASVFSVISPSPAAGLTPPIGLTYSESDTQMTLQLSGGSIGVDSSQTISIAGAYWAGTFGITQDAGSIWDVVSSSGSFTHTKGPHSDDGFGGTMQFKLELSGFFAPPIFDPETTVEIPDKTFHPNKHEDIWSGNIDGSVSVFSDINTWSAFIQATHVPEPSTLAVFCLGLIGLASRRFKKQ